MKFPLSWLRYYLDTDADLATILRTLNDIGLEVEGVENPAEKLTGFRIARVLTAAPHPQADKLQVLSVDAGEGAVQVVCGAPNARAGLIGVFGTEGAVVPANGMVLKKTAIRGVESNGMMCSTRELELGEDHDGIIELAEDAPLGMAFADYAKLDDPVIDISVTPNRQDCMGVMGIARDLAAAGLGVFRPVEVPVIAGEFPCPVEIRTDDPDGCPAFYGRVIRGVKNGPSPDWMQARLKAIGQRPISALVDCTNYLMFACGRPAHVYDLAKLSGPVVARRAHTGERMTALNGKEYALTPDMTVIADDAGVHDIAGIMGGEHSGCSDDTVDVLLEIAYFTPEHIARTGQALQLSSDARSRFERGVDPAFLDDALALLTDLVVQTCGGTASHVVRAGQPPVAPHAFAYDPASCARLAGVAVDEPRQRAILDKLGFGVAADWTVTVPSWRRDVDGVADIVEEVVRIHGLANVPSTPLPRQPGVARPTATPEQMVERKVRRAAAARGLNEAINWSFLSEKEAASVGGGAWMLANPISEDLKVMRPSLLPGLLSAAARNQARGATSVRLFEVGRRYFRADDGSSIEKLTLGLVMAGDKIPRGWQAGRAQPFTAYDAKGEALALLAAAGAPVGNIQMFGDAGASYHPGQSGTLRLGPKVVLAEYGVLHPALARDFGLNGTVVAAQIFLDALPAKRKAGFMRAPFTPPALQAVTRDFAFLVPDALEADALVRAVRGADKRAIVDARVFDMFTGAGVEAGFKSLAVEITLQPGEKSFTEPELAAISAAVVTAAQKLGAVLRG